MAKSPPAVSVLLPAFNAQATLARAVESILAQTYRSWELLIVDDGSSDATRTIAEGFADPRIRLIRNAKNMGIAASCNKAWAAARGEFIARQDADDYSYPTRLEKQVAYLRTHPEVAVLGSDRHTFTGSGKVRTHKSLPERVTSESLLRQNPIINGSVLMRHATLKHVGGYDEWFIMAEDYDLWLRIVKAGFAIRNLPETLYAHQQHEDSATTQKPRTVELYAIAAINQAQGKLTAAQRRQVETHGIEAFAQHLNPDDILALTKRLASAYKKTGRYDEALAEYQKWESLAGATWKTRRNIWQLKWKRWQRR